MTAILSEIYVIASINKFDLVLSNFIILLSKKTLFNCTEFAPDLHINFFVVIKTWLVTLLEHHICSGNIKEPINNGSSDSFNY